MEFKQYLIEAYNERMKQSIPSKILTKIGKFCSANHISVEDSTFERVPPYRFRLGQALPNKTGDNEAKFGFVVAIRKSDDMPLIIIVRNKGDARYLEVDDNFRTQSLPIRHFDVGTFIRDSAEFVKGLKDVYIIKQQKDVYDLQDKRRESQKGDRLTDEDSKETRLRNKIQDKVAAKKMKQDARNDPYASKIVKKIEAVPGFSVEQMARTRSSRSGAIRILVDIAYKCQSSNEKVAEVFNHRFGNRIVSVDMFGGLRGNEYQVTAEIPQITIDKDADNNLETFDAFIKEVENVNKVYKILCDLDVNKLPEVAL